MSEKCPEERATYVVLVLAGAGPVVATLLAGGRAGAGVTISFLMLAAGVIGMVSSLWERHDRPVPTAYQVRRSSRVQMR